MKESMSKAGYDQGNMSAKVVDYQKPMKDYSQNDANMTTEYVERQDRQQGSEASQIRKQAYKGRYR